MQWSLVTAFSIALGHLAWNSQLGPTPTPKYFVGGEEVPALAGPDPEAKQLYLRREIYLRQLPRHSWIQVIGHDRLVVVVNGELVAREVLDGFPVSVVADLTPYLKSGINVIGIIANQATIGQSPVVAVDGIYALDDGEHRIEADELWRCHSSFERRAHWWFSPEFKDRHWEKARLTPCSFRASVQSPPRAVTTRSLAQWITPAQLNSGSAALRREFVVGSRPRQAWLRVMATSSYRLAVNGVLLDEQEDQLSTTTPVPPVQRTYDITRVVRPGNNVLAFVVTSTAGPPHLMADAGVEDESDQRGYWSTGEGWQSRAGLADDWMETAVGGMDDWQPCQVETGDLDIMPWQRRTKTVEISLPGLVIAERVAKEIGLMAIIGFITFGACRITARTLALIRGETRRTSTYPIVYAALMLPALAIGGAVLATYDPRVGAQEVFQAKWVWLALASVVVPWCLLGLTAFARRTPLRERVPAFSVYSRAGVVGLAGLLLVGGWLRFRNMETEPMHWDEVEVYRNTMGFLARGFPSVEVHQDLPPVCIHTSELLFASTGLAALVFEEDKWVVRFPAVCWSMLTIVLIYAVGARILSTPAGLIAAALYTISPVCISMSNFGRYFAQLQFLTLLTVYLFWLTIRGSGAISRRALWGTAVSFIAMFLTWEASGLIALGMIVAAIVFRRGRLRPLLTDGATWLAMATVLLAVVLQQIHLISVQTQFLWYGVSLSDVTLKAMWRLPTFQPFYYIWESSWNTDMLLPMMGLGGAVVLAIRHPFRRAVRFILLIYLGTCMTMVLILPNIQWRYIYQLTPLLILLASAVVGAMARALARLARRIDTPWAWRLQAAAIATACSVLVVALSSGVTVQLAEMPRFIAEGYGRLSVYQFPNLDGPARFLRDHIEEGDVVLSNDFQQLHHLMRLGGKPDGRPEPDRPLDYWLASTLFLPATLDDCRDVPLDRRDGSVMIANLESLEDLFARHHRVWYVLQPENHQRTNTHDVSAYLRQHMEVVYEDWQTLVLFRGDHHRVAEQRHQDDRVLGGSVANYLP
jgi:hypothetical protein